MGTIGVTGYQGRLGRTLVSLGCVPLECDITDEDQIREAMGKVRPDVVINCAAFTAVDAAEEEINREAVIKTNFKSVTNLYRKMRNAHLIHISTDYVFGGVRGPYSETSRFSVSDLPVNFYGQSKQVAEASLQWLPKTTIVRTTGLFGVGEDFVSFLVGKLKNREPIDVADNLFANQTYVPFLAKDLIQLACMEDKPEILHLASKDVMSRYTFAQKIQTALGIREFLLNPVASNKIQGWVAERPNRGGLSTKLAARLGFTPYTVSDGIDAYLKRS